MSGERKKAFEVKWRIENIRPWLQTMDDSLYSTPFPSKSMMNTRWKLRLSRKWWQAENCTSLTLHRYADDYPESIALNYELSFSEYDGSPLKSKTCTTKFAPKTVSQELILTGVEILEEKREAYFPRGVLTICCKLWMPWSTISKGGQCSIRSVIGRKCITLDGTIDYFSRLDYDSNVTVNFMSTSSEINFISFYVHLQTHGPMWFERIEVECKCFSSYSCKLFALNASGERTECVNSICLATLLTSHKSCSFQTSYSHGYFSDSKFLKNDTLTLQLEITYYPGIELECIEYDDSNYKKLTDESADLENVNSSNSEKVHSRNRHLLSTTLKEDLTSLYNDDSTDLENVNTSNSADVHSSPLDSLHLTKPEDKACDIDKNDSGNEDEYFYAAGKRRFPSTTLKEDLTTLYNDCLFCDTKLRTDTETFPAHRSVLSARSPVFKKMLTTDMKEKAGECINVPDISSDTVRRMLKFLYTDCTGDPKMHRAKDLYIASDKYDIASLKQHCSSFMKKNLCPANVCEVLVLADMHQDKDLESAAQEYVLTNDEEVFYSDEWKLFMKKLWLLSSTGYVLEIHEKINY
ncbi:TD and POZ domain-containing protein 5 [Araneus ventricosus]|uniref:TD and POZ domain-containing protein 5 n=1 Tax=Araneus ventricosus TaxID=182803 RepID=A0A4Y2WQD2_ARAVE|nr:TD and POZ domain-containing protein 5 [Araneus ventricosus]